MPRLRPACPSSASARVRERERRRASSASTSRSGSASAASSSAPRRTLLVHAGPDARAPEEERRGASARSAPTTSVTIPKWIRASRFGPRSSIASRLLCQSVEVDVRRRAERRHVPGGKDAHAGGVSRVERPVARVEVGDVVRRVARASGSTRGRAPRPRRSATFRSGTGAISPNRCPACRRRGGGRSRRGGSARSGGARRSPTPRPAGQGARGRGRRPPPRGRGGRARAGGAGCRSAGGRVLRAPPSAPGSWWSRRSPGARDRPACRSRSSRRSGRTRGTSGRSVRGPPRPRILEG